MPEQMPEPLGGHVVAVIVTYNRRDLLRGCLEAVLNQTYHPLTVLVVDNASSDGTAVMLDAEYADRVNLLRMDCNVGGGGGFYRGMKWAYENGADWLWLMDDDGVPDSQSLAIMMAPENSGRFDLMNPLVIARHDKSVVAFGLEVDGKPTKSVDAVLAHAKPDLFLPGQINPFNGTLVKRSLVERVGYPKREMFIWGDEVDYTRRVAESGAPYATILNSFHTHPAPGQPLPGAAQAGRPATEVKRINLGIFGSIDPTPPARIGISARNMGYNYSKRGSLKLSVFKPIVVLLYYVSQGKFRDGYDFIRYYIDGFFDHYRLSPSRKSLFEDGERFEVRTPNR